MATNTNDSPAWLNVANYANTGAGGGFDKYSCSLYGNDVDDDSICDNWESNSGANPGLHINFTSSKLSSKPVSYVYNLSCNTHATYTPNPSDPQNVVDPTGLSVCPSPNHKDIYVEVDWMTGQGPVNATKMVGDVVSAYLNHGIYLHIQAGEYPQNGSPINSTSGNIGKHYCDVVISNSNNGSPGTCSATTTNAQSYVNLKQNFFGTVAERSGNHAFCSSNAMPTGPGNPAPLNNYSYNCLTAKRQSFHYATFDNYQWGNIPSSGWAEVMGNDFLISLGNFTNGVGSIDEQEASLMHELGHNLGLYHGGMPPPTGNQDEDNCKPNYLSVMSYTYEFRKTADICRPLDYSDRNLTSYALNEASLNDSRIASDPYPVNNPPPPSGTKSGQPSSCPTSGERPIWWSTPTGSITSNNTGATEDWNLNGVSSATFAQNINKLGIAGCNTDTKSSLGYFNDWHYILNGNSNFLHPLNFRLNVNFYSGIPSGNNDVEVGPDPTIYLYEANQNNDTVTLTPHPTEDTTFPAYVVSTATIIAIIAVIAIIVIAIRRRH